MLKVLIALDGSTLSDRAVAMAGQLLSGKEAEVTLLHVIPRHLTYGKGGPVVAECCDLDEEESSSMALLDMGEQQLGDDCASVAIAKEVEIGDPSECILAEAARLDTDLIILGSRGLNAAQRFLLGSVSSRVSLHARCPVLVVHPKMSLSDEPLMMDQEQVVAAV
jgi:nucleotide-binding universal stress UspA family protein